MLGTPIVNLLDLIEGGEEEALNNILVEFSCPYIDPPAWVED